MTTAGTDGETSLTTLDGVLEVSKGTAENAKKQPNIKLFNQAIQDYKLTFNLRFKRTSMSRR